MAIPRSARHSQPRQRCGMTATVRVSMSVLIDPSQRIRSCPAALSSLTTPLTTRANVDAPGRWWTGCRRQGQGVTVQNLSARPVSPPFAFGNADGGSVHGSNYLPRSITNASRTRRFEWLPARALGSALQGCPDRLTCDTFRTLVPVTYASITTANSAWSIRRRRSSGCRAALGWGVEASPPTLLSGTHRQAKR
jgi:hypothetical protein